MAYGLSLDLRYGSKLHDMLRRALIARIEFSEKKMARLWDKWEESEKLFALYVNETEADAARRTVREGGVPQYTTVTVPYSYATLLTAHTYWASVFLSRVPIFQFTARHGEPEMNVQAVEAIIDYQVTVGNMVPAFYFWLLDAGRYGFGVLGNYWAEEVANVTRIVERPKEFAGIPIPGTSEKVKETVTVKGYQGNKVYNIRPHDFIFDPRVSLANLQDGEYAGRHVLMGWNEVVRRAAAGEFFNVEQLARSAYNYYSGSMMSGIGRRKTTDLVELPAEPGDFSYVEDPERGASRPAIVEADEIVLELIPRDYGISASGYPEKWVFTLAYRDVLIGARPLGCYHNRYPYFIQSYEFEPYGVSGRSLLETIKPLNDVLDWLFNSHMYNVRAGLNDRWVADPSRVVWKDVMDPEPGKLIRLRPEAYGTDVRTAIAQFPVVDVTSGHLRSLQAVLELIQRVTGVSDNLMGLLDPGGRKTATEVRTSSSFGINRLKTISEFNSALGWSPLAAAMLQNTQQYYDGSMKLRLVGDLPGDVQRFVVVSPEEISGFYDFVPVDGTLPVDRFAQANLWKEILIGLRQMPELAQQYDLGRIFAWMAQLAGLKNVNQFRRSVQVVPDQQVLSGLEAGNLLPIGEARPPMTPEIAGALEGGQ